MSRYNFYCFWKDENYNGKFLMKLVGTIIMKLDAFSILLTQHAINSFMPMLS